MGEREKARRLRQIAQGRLPASQIQHPKEPSKPRDAVSFLEKLRKLAYGK